MHLGCKHEGMHAGRIDRHVGVVHPDDREYVSHGFVDVMDGLLLHDRGLCLLDDESVFAEGFMRTLVEFAGEKAFTGSDRVGAVDDDDIIEVLDGFRKGDAVSYMDVKLFRRIKERGCNGREVFLGEFNDAAVDVSEVDLLDAVVTADFSGYAAVTAADDEYSFRIRVQHERHVGDHLVICPFIFDGCL